MRNLLISPGLTAAAACLFLASAFAARPQELQIGKRDSNNIWVTVDATGGAQTITPVVTTVNGAATTLSTAPPSLIATGTYTLSPSGQLTTSTGSPPVAAPTGTGIAGAFLFCDTFQIESPFCQPQPGTQLNPGSSYYVTWSSETFANTSTIIQIQGDYDNGTGFASPEMPVSEGFWTWTVDPNLLSGQGQLVVNVTLYISFFQPQDGDGVLIEMRLAGPTVHVATPNPSQGSSGSSGVSPVVIAIPIVVGLLVLATAVLVLLRYRRASGRPLRIFGIGPKRGSSYGDRNARPEQVDPNFTQRFAKGDKPSPDIQLTDRDSWSPTTLNAAYTGGNGHEQGRNLFREELQRQEQVG